MSDKLNPCPFCGVPAGYRLQDGDTYRWWDVMCADCGEPVATCHSDRRTTIGGIMPDRWEPADEAWNKASQHAADLQARAESAEAERDRYRDALIACRPAALRDFDRYRMMVRTEEAKRIAALLDTISAAAAAKGQG